MRAQDIAILCALTVAFVLSLGLFAGFHARAENVETGSVEKTRTTLYGTITGGD